MPWKCPEILGLIRNSNLIEVFPNLRDVASNVKENVLNRQ